jgi:hypothetical protein
MDRVRTVHVTIRQRNGGFEASCPELPTPALGRTLGELMGNLIEEVNSWLGNQGNAVPSLSIAIEMAGEEGAA